MEVNWDLVLTSVPLGNVCIVSMMTEIQRQCDKTYSKIGLFRNVHAAKCVLCSWIVKAPFPVVIQLSYQCQYSTYNRMMEILPISIISMSLWAPKLTADKCAKLVLMMLVM